MYTYSGTVEPWMTPEVLERAAQQLQSGNAYQGGGVGGAVLGGAFGSQEAYDRAIRLQAARGVQGSQLTGNGLLNANNVSTVAKAAMLAGAGFAGAGALGFGPLAGDGAAAGSVAGGAATGLAPGAGVLAPAAATAGTAGIAAGAPAGAAALAGTGVGAAGGAMAGIGLPGWLTVGSLAAQALQSDKDITSSSTNEPPAYLKPYLGQAAAGAEQAYRAGTYVSPVQQAAAQYGTNVLSGNYLNANPYLDATFNKAAGAVTNQVQSNFAGAGRDARGADAQGLATDKYSELATQIYGGNYQAERDRMQQLVPQANQLGAIGNPNMGLDDYIARLRGLSGGYGTTTSNTPTDTNWLSGLAGLGLALMPGG